MSLIILAIFLALTKKIPYVVISSEKNDLYFSKFGKSFSGCLEIPQNAYGCELEIFGCSSFNYRLLCFSKLFEQDKFQLSENICKDPELTINEKEACYINLLERNTDSLSDDYCKNDFISKRVKEACYLQLALKMNNESICELAGSKKNNCKFIVGYQNVNPDACRYWGNDRVADENAINFCIRQMAVEKCNKSLCDEAGEHREACLIEYQKFCK